jgi:DNA-binding LacI/PurR family transcriptional regulator
MSDVAHEAGVSRALVSIVYRGVEGASEQTRRHVLEVGQRLGYRRNALAARLASRTVQSIGVLMFDMRNDLTADVFAGIQAEADERGIGVVAGISDPSGNRDARAVNDLLSAQVDVLIMISGFMPGAQIRELAQSIPIVSATRAVRGLDSVVSDEAEAGGLVVSHLVERGYRDIVHLAPPWRPSQRVAAFETAMTEAGLRPRVETIQYDAKDTRRVTRGLLDGPHRPQAIYANNDIAAYAVLDAAREAGLRVPEDIAVVGFDNLQTSALGVIDLTTVDQQPVALGRLAVRTALERAADHSLGPRRKVLRPRLVVRGSSGPVTA